MQLISHKNTALTICQRFFIEKSLELLYLGSIDSYRVRLNNPKSALIELKYCLEEFDAGRIKHFQTIKSKDKNKKAIIDEALMLLASDPNYLIFQSISSKYLKHLLDVTTEQDYKKIISAIELLLEENASYLSSVIDGIETLITSNNPGFLELSKIDKSLNILFSELIHMGFSKGFLYKLVYGIFVNSLGMSRSFNDHFTNFKTRILLPKSQYQVVFRIDTTPKVYHSISTINNPILTLSDNINDIQLNGRQHSELVAFNSPAKARKFIRCTITATDFLAALKKARSILSEYLDVINLGLSDEFLHIHQRALVIDNRSPQQAAFQNNVNILDGKYRAEKAHYAEFTLKLPAILNNQLVQHDSKEKIKSAIRYLRLGQQSTEVEHKFINYWIGLEYLFSNYESQSTIHRIKDHFINSHALAYVKRNAFSFKSTFEQISSHDQTKIPSYTRINSSCLGAENFYLEISTQLLNDYPLLAFRAMELHQWFFIAGKQPNAVNYIKKHRENLEMHFTRIYRLRNEIIHDAATNTNSELIASNLRYYLTFILNELIDFLSKNPTKKISIEDYFILNEIELGNIENNGYPLNQLLDVDCSIGFIS
ncbi:MAG: hypothetical protein J0H74_15385 [Chitinophagaceae bacterium]|nr:hypothetical protein [Chitinophagaceae bacterium]